eukprot:TRINITY_DN19044_c0_g1_i2.p3 TRINITY_DN19044_c0_g1~~TRINITY_DN19044_c0_g1_i2.p3  ORF type:complete len:341 (-),score=52.62 TRINITY_DN19044_c0_g1_i2:54-1076(-)
MTDTLPSNLRVTVVGVTLWATHPEQVSDVFLVIGLGAYSAKTQIRRRAQNVTWNESFSFTLDKPASNIEVVLHEKNAQGLRILGTVTAPLSVVTVKPECTLTVTKENAPVGSVLLKLEPITAYSPVPNPAPAYTATVAHEPIYNASVAPTPAYSVPPSVSFAPVQQSFVPVVQSVAQPVVAPHSHYPERLAPPQHPQPSAPVEPVVYTRAPIHTQPAQQTRVYNQDYPETTAVPKNDTVAALEAEIRRIDAQNRLLTSKYQLAVECLRDSIQFERDELERSLTKMQHQAQRKHSNKQVEYEEVEEPEKDNRKEDRRHESERHRRRRRSRSRSRRRVDDNF